MLIAGEIEGDQEHVLGIAVGTGQVGVAAFIKGAGSSFGVFKQDLVAPFLGLFAVGVFGNRSVKRLDIVIAGRHSIGTTG